MDRWLDVLRLRLRSLFFPRAVERDLDEELQYHVAQQTAENVARGMDPGPARRAALVAFGGVEYHKEQTRDNWGASMTLYGLGRDVRYGFRILSRARGFATITILTVAIGVAANTFVFSLLSAVLLKPLAFPDGDALVQVTQLDSAGAESRVPPARLEDWNRMNTASFSAITGYYAENVTEVSGDMPERVRRAMVAPRFPEVWRVVPERGRWFPAEAHEGGGPNVVVISNRHWLLRYGGRPDVLDQLVRIDSTSYTIVGVMPASFRFPDRDVDLWFPVRLRSGLLQERNARWFAAIGRLRPGVALSRARDDLRAAQALLAAQFPRTDRSISVEPIPLKDVVVGDVRRSLWLIFGAVCLLLVIMCSNIAALLLSRAADREREITIRRSLGASRRAVAVQLIVESGVLAAVGSGLGLLLAALAIAALQSAFAGVPRAEEIVIDPFTILYTVGLACVITLASGVLPAVRLTRKRSDLDLLGAGGRSIVSSRNRVQWALVAVQVTLAVSLLTGAALLVRSFYALSGMEAGFDPRNVVTFRITGSYAETSDRARLAQRIDERVQRLSALPGVSAVATSGMLPGVTSAPSTMFTIGEASQTREAPVAAVERVISPGYFAALRIPVIAGELCTDRAADEQAMVNRAFARRHASAFASPLGLHVAPAERPNEITRIVGVVADARELGMGQDPEPTVYACRRTSNPHAHYLVRTTADPSTIFGTMRAAIKEIEPMRALYGLQALDDRIADTLSTNRLRTAVLLLFAAAALSLACVGLYGTLSYVVSVRRREIGLRIALGGRQADIVRHFLFRAMRVAVVACVLGSALSVAFGRVLEGMVYGVSTTDALTHVAVVSTVLVVAALAALIPALRAGLVQPMRVLREE